VQIDLGVTSGMQLKQILGLARLANKAGFDNVWIGDDICLPHDVFTVASIVLLDCPQMNVGIGITSPLIRNISTIARASVSLVEIGGSRPFRLGLGIGGLQDLARLGINVKNHKCVMRNAVTLLRRIWKGETLSFQSAPFVLEDYHTGYVLDSQIQIFFGVRGPRLLKLAGERADGVILSGPKIYLEKAIRLVKESVEKSSEPTRNFQLVVWVPTILIQKQSDLKFAERTVAFVLADTPKKVLEMAKLDQDRVEKIKTAYQKSGIEKASTLVTKELIEKVAIRGSATQICGSFQSLERLGVQEVVFGPPYGLDPDAAITGLGQAWRKLS
jgi:alkanesulfonate monooxygenase SsuD/methylene tetrahydromethanopterin reductase-like flavin-dependent oxidoreductase (luciferase family)